MFFSFLEIYIISLNLNIRQKKNSLFPPPPFLSHSPNWQSDHWNLSDESSIGNSWIVSPASCQVKCMVLHPINDMRVPYNNLRFLRIFHHYIYSLLSFSCSEEVERCQTWSENFTQQIDLAFNIFFMVYYFIRVSV